MDHIYDLKEVFSHFQIYGDFVSAENYGGGHINDTFAVDCIQAGETVRYIFQRINHVVFPRPEELMENIHRICSELQSRLEGHPDASRRSLTTLLTYDDKPYYIDGDGNYWRVYLFIEGAVGYDIIENEEQAYQAARAFGEFQKLLTDLPGGRLHETIPGFHDTPKRFQRFREVLDADPEGLKASVPEEIAFILSYEDEVSRLVDLVEAGDIPERVTHNDTKLNNVLIDKATNEAVCVIDLDTAMPGLAAYDFGDLVRTSTSPVAEDEPDASKVLLQKDMFKALTRGYLSSAASFLTSAERDTLVLGGKIITLEVAMRFLTDYLEGNIYFKTKYDEHNLVRCRTQIALVREIEKHQEELEGFVQSEYERVKETCINF